MGKCLEARDVLLDRGLRGALLVPDLVPEFRLLAHEPLRFTLNPKP